MKLLLDDCDEQIGRHGAPDLRLHRVLANAQETRDAQMLYDPFEWTFAVILGRRIMKKPLLLATVASAVMLLSSAPSFGQAQGQCKAIEFAELQTFDKGELDRAFCGNKRTMDSATRMEGGLKRDAQQYAELELSYLKIRNQRGADKALDDSRKSSREAIEYAAAAANCASENERISKFLAKQKDKTPPNC